MDLKRIYYELVMSQTKEKKKEEKNKLGAGRPSMDQLKGLDQFKLGGNDNKFEMILEDEEAVKAVKSLPIYKISLKMWQYHGPEKLLVYI